MAARESSLLLRDARTLHVLPRTSLDGWSKSLDAMANRQNVVGDGRLAKGFGRFLEGAGRQVNTLDHFDHCLFRGYFSRGGTVSGAGSSK